jgi:S1-C subfamily serine protease
MLGVACSATTANTGTNLGSTNTSSSNNSTQNSSAPAPAKKTSGTYTTADLVKYAEPAVVRIQTNSGVGTGFFVTDDGYIMTNNHVVEGARKITVTMSDGMQYTGTVKGTDARSDLALLHIDATGLKPIALASLDDIDVGQDVVAIGYALDLEGGDGAGFSVTTGIVSAKNRGIEENSTILGAVQTDAAINHGNSGGPLLTRSGLLVGVNTALAADNSTGGDAYGIAFAVGSDTVKAVYEALKTDGAVNRGVLGIANFSALRPADVAAKNLPEGTEGVVLGANPAVPTNSRLGGQQSQAVSGAAAAAGLKSGDVITKIGDDKVTDEASLAIALIKHKAGSTVAVEYYRDGQKMTAQVTLGAATS